MKRVFIIHGWGGHSNEHWLPWLKRELEKSGFQVIIPQMPDADTPRIETWVPHLAKVVGKPDKDTYLIGHSMGCQTILRYLQSINGEVGGAVFVAGFFVRLTGLDAEEQPVAQPWMETPLNFDKIKQTTKNFVAIFSDNDEFVPPENAKGFEEKLGAKIIIEKEKGHFCTEDGVTELPSALNAVLEMAK